MTLLAPMSLLVGALVALPLVLALYLLKLRRRPMRVGSMMFWPQAAEDVQANVPLRWLRPSWLLLLHVLMVACLLLALGRPAIGGSGISGERVVLLIDASASMSAIDDAGSGLSRLERAKRRAKDLCEQLSGGWFRPASSIAVVGFAHRPKVVSGFTTSPAMLAALIDGIEATDQPGDLAAALQLVDTLVHGEERSQEVAEKATPTIVLLSDGAFGIGDAQGEARPAKVSGLVRFERMGPSGDVGANAGVVAISAQRDAVDPVLVRVFARIAQNQPRTLEAIVTLAVDGEVVARRGVAIGPAEPSKGVGEAEVVFEARIAGPGVCTVRVDSGAAGDALASDSSASVVLDGAAAPRIAIVRAAGMAAGGEAARRAGGAPQWMLGDVLREIAGKDVVVLSPEAVAANEPAYDLFVFDRCATPQLARVPTISLGSVPALARVRMQPGEVRPRAAALSWDRDHPILSGITLDTLVVSKVLRIEIAEGPGGASVATPAPMVLARSDDAPLLVLAREAGNEHLVVAFALEDTNWPLQAGFPVFMANAVEHLTAARAGRLSRAFTTTQAVKVRVASTTSVSLVGPSTIVLRDHGAPSDEAVELAAGVIERVGVYVVRGGGSPPEADRAVCVDLLDVGETSLVSPSEVRVDGVPLQGVVGTPAPREVWMWCVVALLALLVIEWVVYARQARA